MEVARTFWLTMFVVREPSREPSSAFPAENVTPPVFVATGQREKLRERARCLFMCRGDRETQPDQSCCSRPESWSVIGIHRHQDLRTRILLSASTTLNFYYCTLINRKKLPLFVLNRITIRPFLSASLLAGSLRQPEVSFRPVDLVDNVLYVKTIFAFRSPSVSPDRPCSGCWSM